MLGIIPRLAAVMLAFFFSLNLLNADSFRNRFHWSFSGSLFYFPANNGVDSDPAPIIPNVGVSVAVQIWGPLRIEITEDLYFTNYEWNLAGHPMACNPENRAAFVLGFITGIQLTGVFPIRDKGMAVRVYGGPAADLRVITRAIGLNHPGDYTGGIENNVNLQTEAIRKYFWSSGRWFMPVVGAGMDFPVSQFFMLGFDLRVWFPIYKIWAKDSASAIDGWRFGAGIRITPRPRSSRNSSQ